MLHSTNFLVRSSIEILSSSNVHKMESLLIETIRLMFICTPGKVISLTLSDLLHLFHFCSINQGYNRINLVRCQFDRVFLNFLSIPPLFLHSALCPPVLLSMVQGSSHSIFTSTALPSPPIWSNLKN